MASFDFTSLPDHWPNRWLKPLPSSDANRVDAYRLKFTLDQSAEVPVAVTADQRYWLFVNGEWSGRGPERGDLLHWRYETWRLQLQAGENVIVAIVWHLDHTLGRAPAAQFTVEPGFLLAGTPAWNERLGTGQAAWETCRAPGLSVDPSFHGAGFLAGGLLTIDAQEWPAEIERGGDDHPWRPAEHGPVAQQRLSSKNWGDAPAHRLQPAALPPQFTAPLTPANIRHAEKLRTPETDDIAVEASNHDAPLANSFRSLLADGAPLTINPGECVRGILDLDDYDCVYLHVSAQGAGGRIRLTFAEALYLEAATNTERKGNRDEIEQRYFHGRAFNVKTAHAEKTLPSLWWHCGRYVEITLQAGDEPLRVSGLRFTETRYPLEREDAIELPATRFADAAPIMWRTLQMCAHETYMDCPYYEQLQYGGDTRTEILTTFACTRDRALPRKAIDVFGASMLPTGFTQSRYPCRITQVIPNFTLAWVMMAHDYALWTDEPEFIRAQLPAIRRALDAFIAQIGDDGLMRVPEGWNWIDWSEPWKQNEGYNSRGHPLVDESNCSGIQPVWFIYAADRAAELERWIGEDTFADRLDRICDSLMKTYRKTFWNAERRMFSDQPSGQTFSEHAQCLALLTGRLDDDEQTGCLAALENPPADIAPATVYFVHYVFEAFREARRPGLILDRMQFWYDLVDQGFKTCIEKPDPSRSDCHAWGAHPLFHAHATFMGIRPASFGFNSVDVTPQLANLKEMRTRLPHPQGDIVASYANGKLTVTLPEGLDGAIQVDGESRKLSPGANEVMLV